jgi:hypothetical protein
MKELEIGIHNDIPIEVYHANKLILSSSGLKQAKESSRHFAYYITTESERKSHFDFGNAFEVALLDAISGTKDAERTIGVRNTERWTELALNEKPDLKSPKASATYKTLKTEFEKVNESKYLIDDVGNESWATIEEMIASCKADKTITKVLEKTDYQKSFVWMDADTGVLCKTRPDLAVNRQKVIVDIKTTLDASPAGFFRQCANLDYPLQAIMQIEGVEQSGYIDHVDDYYWLAVEKNPPFNAQLYRFQKADRELIYDAYKFYVSRAAKVINDFKDGKITAYTQVKGYSESSDNVHGVIDFELPLYYSNNLR